MAWLWLPLVLDQMGWRRKEGQLVEAFPALYYVTSALCHMRNDENELDRKSTRLNSSHLARSRMPSSA